MVTMQEHFGFITDERSEHRTNIRTPDVQTTGGRTTKNVEQFITDQPVDWRLDEHTRLLGRQGIAAARARLELCGTKSSLASAA